MVDQQRKPHPCRGCGATIFFGQTDAGRAMPLDAKPTTVWQVDDAGRVLGKVEGHQSHWSTCPKADDFRKAKR